jgi:hypothetical protein
MAFGGTDFRTDREMKTEITPILHHIQREAVERKQTSRATWRSYATYTPHTHIQRRSCSKAKKHGIRNPLTHTCPTYTPRHAASTHMALGTALKALTISPISSGLE